MSFICQKKSPSILKYQIILDLSAYQKPHKYKSKCWPLNVFSFIYSIKVVERFSRSPIRWAWFPYIITTPPRQKSALPNKRKRSNFYVGTFLPSSLSLLTERGLQLKMVQLCRWELG